MLIRKTETVIFLKSFLKTRWFLLIPEKERKIKWMYSLPCNSTKLFLDCHLSLNHRTAQVGRGKFIKMLCFKTATFPFSVYFLLFFVPDWIIYASNIHHKPVLRFPRLTHQPHNCFSIICWFQSTLWCIQALYRSETQTGDVAYGRSSWKPQPKQV